MAAGGRRDNSGRKRVPVQRVTISTRVSNETRERIDRLKARGVRVRCGEAIDLYIEKIFREVFGAE